MAYWWMQTQAADGTLDQNHLRIQWKFSKLLKED